MEFELRVTFTGLCIFLIREDCRQVAVLQPDCRVGGRLPQTHADGDPGVPHVGYLRFDMGNMHPSLGLGDDISGPVYEGVHRFTGEELDFGIEDDGSTMSIQTFLPAMERIAPHPENQPEVPQVECGHGDQSLLQPVDGLFGPDAPLVMRTILAGGGLTGEPLTAFEFDPVFDPSRQPYAGTFSKRVVWTRRVRGDVLNVRIRPFAEGQEVVIPLHPILRDGDEIPSISLTLANLCNENPLEWKEYGAPTPTRSDEDFKWLYRPFRSVTGEPVEILPIPRRPDKAPLGGENCTGTRMTVGSFQ